MSDSISDWWVYILCCADDTLYTGVAKDVVKRLDEHNHSPKAAKYTRVRRPVQVVYVEPVADRSAAMKRELAIKALSRKNKKQLITDRATASTGYADTLQMYLCVML
jgi:putative endonuclease